MRTSLAATIDCTQGGNGQRCLRDGWHAPEPDRTWAAGVRSTLSVAAPFAPYGYILEFDWLVLLDPPAVVAQPLRIGVDGVLVHDAPVSRNGLMAFLCPPPSPAATRLAITIEHPAAIRPSERLGEADGRDLSVALRRLRVFNAEDAAVTTPVFTASATLGGGDVDSMAQDAARVAGVDLPTMFAGFELIAGDCDMGLAMRAFGHESLSLLRFGGARPEVAVRLLDTAFAGIGERLHADVADNPQAEWMVDDAAGLRFHSGRSSRDTDAAALLPAFGRQVRRLADKLLEEVAEDAKVFVWADDGVASRGLATVLPLYLALRRRGGMRMLWVCPAGPGTLPAGSATVILPGLVQAFLGDAAAPDTAAGLKAWLSVLVNAWLVFDALRRQRSAAPTGGAPPLL